MNAKTLDDIAFAILEAVRPKALTGETITIDLIKHHIIDVRAMLIKQDINKGHSIDSWLIQDLGCIDLELVDRSECCDIDLGCTFLRTVQPIPSTIEIHHSQLITRVGPIDKLARPYELIKYNRITYTGKRRFSKKLIRAFFKDDRGYLYLMVDPLDAILLEKVNVQGVFEDPRAAKDFSQCSGEVCYSDSTSMFPVKAWMIPAIEEIVLNKFIAPESKALIDETNDSRNEYRAPIDKT